MAPTHPLPPLLHGSGVPWSTRLQQAPRPPNRAWRILGRRFATQEPERGSREDGEARDGPKGKRERRVGLPHERRLVQQKRAGHNLLSAAQ